MFHGAAGSPEVCKICGKAFKDIEYLKKHSKLVHAALKTFVCCICQKAFTAQKMLNIHMLTHKQLNDSDCDNKRDLFLCEICGKGFPIPSKVERHKRMAHAMTKSELCKTCGKAFSDVEYLKKHIKFSHEASKKFLCSFCPKAFQTQHLLDKHKMVHTG